MMSNIRVFFFLLAFAITLSGSTGGEEQRICWYTSRTVGHLSVQHIETSPDYADDLDNGIVRIQGPNQTCTKRTNYCYALWKEDQNSKATNGIIIIAQGCWESSGKQDCKRNSCVTSRKPPKALNDTNFCCCQGDFCNGNVSQIYVPEKILDDILPTPVIKQIEKPYIFIVIVLVVLFIITASCSSALIILSKKSLKQKEEVSRNSHPESLRLMENGTIHKSNFTVENLKLEKIIGQGRYGVVWKGIVGSQDIAVKIFPSHHRNYFYNELDIYCAPFMAHPSLLSYFGFDERITSEGNPEYFLFVSYIPNGNLQEYLLSHVINWTTFCKMALTITKGIAYLHSDIKKGGKFKPCISHRDLNSKNILVKDDLTCAICDLGFATKISGSKYFYNGEEQHAEIKSINDVGTLRYMAPEVLEGAVNLRDCETSLKQIDVYALGLIIWEIASRCSDFYPPGIDCAPYKLPFEAEIDHPTFEQMQNLICKKKARPLFPDLWRDTPAVRSVKETIEDCWDQDAEARLTALCVEERFHELSEVSERQKVSFYSHGISPTTRSSVIQNESQNVLVINDSKEGSCVSEFTVETLVATTPANPNPKNSNHFQGIVTSIQPYQGRNPCLERNLMTAQDCDSSSCELINKSQKNCIDSSIVSDFLNVYPSHSTSQNFQNPICIDYTNLSEPVMRSNVPIPFLQNVGLEYQTSRQFNVFKPLSHTKKINWKNFKKFFESKQKPEDMSPQIDCNVKSNLIVNENFINLSTPTATIESKLDTQILFSHGKPETKILWECGRESTTNILGAQNNKRPNTLPLIKSTEQTHSSTRSTKNNVRNVGKILRNLERSNAGQKNSEKRLSFGASGDMENQKLMKTKADAESKELKILRLESEVKKTFNNNLKILNSNKTLVESKLDKTCAVNVKKAETLSLGQEEEASKDDCHQLKNPNLRVKTPGDLPLSVRKIRGEKNAARLSLYDDRMMSGYYNEEIKSNAESGDFIEIFHSAENINFNQTV